MFPQFTLINCFIDSIEERQRSSGNTAAMHVDVTFNSSHSGRGHDVARSYAFVIGFPEGGGDPGLMWGLCKMRISKFLYFPTRGGFFSCKVPSIWRSQAPNWLQNFLLVL